MKYFIGRAREPSTWRGLALMLGSFGVQLHPDAMPAVGGAVVATIAAIEIFRREK